MSKKKFDGILKGLAAAGVVTGGAGIVQDTDVVLAAENTEAVNDSEVVMEEEQPEGDQSGTQQPEGDQSGEEQPGEGQPETQQPEGDQSGR